MEIVIKGEAVVHGPKGGVIRGKELEVFNGLSDDTEFSEYFHKAMPEHMLAGEQQQSLIDAGVTGGFMSFVFEKNQLFVETVYDTPRKLTDHEQKILVEYTQGQWSDGIGEGFEQQEQEGGLSISAWHPKQAVEVIYR